MSRVLITCPGRAGDILWMLPTARALSRRLGQPVDLLICGEFSGLVPLLELQPYLGTVYADPRWSMSVGWEPRDDLGVPIPLRETGCPGAYYDRVLHLGYRRWPELPLPYETLSTLSQHYLPLETVDRVTSTMTRRELCLEEPWITNLPDIPNLTPSVAIGFSECHFELKVGLVLLLERLVGWPRESLCVLTHNKQTRWALDRPHSSYPLYVGPWLEEATVIANSQVFLGCNSGLHVLAVAVGTPVVIYEPMTARHNPIFFPLGWDGPQVQRVVGNDGDWTTDCRHTADKLREVLAR